MNIQSCNVVMARVRACTEGRATDGELLMAELLKGELWKRSDILKVWRPRYFTVGRAAPLHTSIDVSFRVCRRAVYFAKRLSCRPEPSRHEPFILEVCQ